MIYLYSFLFAGTVCSIGQVLMDKVKLKPGEVTSLFVVLGAFLDIFGIYDYFINTFGAGAMVVITSFGHSLIHGALMAAKSEGILGLITGIFSLTASGITSTILFSFVFALIFKPKH